MTTSKTIVINCVFWQNHPHNFWEQEVVIHLLQQHQNQTFILVFAEEITEQIASFKNVIAVKSGKSPKTGFEFLRWYNIKFPLLLKKYNPSVILQPFGFCTLLSKIPQVLVVQDLAFLNYSKAIPKHLLWFYKTITPKSIQKAKQILTPSEYTKQSIIKQYKTSPQKITVAYGAASKNFVPLGFNEQQSIKEQYTQGHNYFLLVGDKNANNQIITVLKAFSQFKKWQQSNFKLVVVGIKNLENVETYKHKNDIVLIDNLSSEALIRLTASAYANICVSNESSQAIAALQSGTPVICNNNNCLPEIAGDAALFFDSNNAQNLAAQMIEMYKNEDLRSSLIQKGIIQAQQFSWEKTAQVVWDVLQNQLQ